MVFLVVLQVVLVVAEALNPSWLFIWFYDEWPLHAGGTVGFLVGSLLSVRMILSAHAAHELHKTADFVGIVFASGSARTTARHEYARVRLKAALNLVTQAAPLGSNREKEVRQLTEDCNKQPLDLEKLATSAVSLHHHLADDARAAGATRPGRALLAAVRELGAAATLCSRAAFPVHFTHRFLLGMSVFLTLASAVPTTIAVGASGPHDLPWAVLAGGAFLTFVVASALSTHFVLFTIGTPPTHIPVLVGRDEGGRV